MIRCAEISQIVQGIYKLLEVVIFAVVTLAINKLLYNSSHEKIATKWKYVAKHCMRLYAVWLY